MTVRACLAAATLLVAYAMPLAATTAAGAAAVSTGSPPNLCAPPADTVGPSATSVTFGRASIDLDHGSREQTVTVKAQDTSGSGPASGVKRVGVAIEGSHSYASPRMTLTSGTPTSGTWTGTFTVSKFARPSSYRLEDLSVTDADRNSQDYPGYGTTPDSPDALSLHPADDPTFQVTGTPATRPPRTPAGTLTHFSISSTHVDTTQTARTVRLSARFAGAQPVRVTVFLADTSRSKKTRSLYLDRTLHRSNGRWTGSARIPRWLGHERLQAGLTADFGSQFRPGDRQYDAQKLNRLHLAHGITVVSGTDRTDPKISALSISPDPIDSTAGAEQVTVTARASDTGSGVHRIDVYGNINHGANGVATGSYPYAASGIGFVSSQSIHVRLRETSPGHWSGTTTVPQCVPSGTYKLTAQLSDDADNYRFYSTRQLAKAHITSTVDVTSKHGDAADPEVYSAATYGADHALFLNFSEGVARVDTSTLSVFALSPRDQRYRTPTTITAIDCSNGTTHVACSGAAGLVTSAELTVPSMKPGHTYVVYGNLDQVVPQLVDGNGNPLDWNDSAVEVLDS